MNSKAWTIKELLNVSVEFLAVKGIESPRLCAEILLAHQLDTSRVKLYLAFDRPLTEDEVNGYRSLIKRRLNREPIQYITGTQEFWSMAFKVNSDVLIPRPETEIILNQALTLCDAEKKSGPFLDLATGSGVLAICLAKEFDEIDIYAADISQKALDMAEHNAGIHGVGSRIKFVCGDLFQPFEDKSPKFDMIVSNPPYVTSAELDTLEKEVKGYEPSLALDGGLDGYCYIEKIIKKSREFLNPDAWILIEMDPGQTEKSVRLFEEQRCFGNIRRIRDYSHKYRVVMAQKTG